MKKKSGFTKFWLLVGCLGLAGLIPLCYVGLGQLVRLRHQQLVSNPELLAILEQGDESALHRFAAANHLEYQLFKDGVVQSSSSQHLPEYRLLPIQTNRGPGVLPIDLAASLAQQLPYTVLINARIYILIPVLVDETRAYVLFSPLFSAS